MGGMHLFTSDDIDVETIRQRLRGMSDEALLRHGRAAAWMADPVAQGRPGAPNLLRAAGRRISKHAL